MAPPVVPRPLTSHEPNPPVPPVYRWEPIRILGVILDEVTQPRNDGTRGSALYRIPFRLSRGPSRMWSELFIKEWDHPSSYTTRHRPEIARVDGDKIVLSGTTIEEVHRDTLVLALKAANQQMEVVEAEMTAQAQREYHEREERDARLRQAAERISSTSAFALPQGNPPAFDGGIRALSLFEHLDEEGLLRVQAVLGLVEDH